MKYLICLCAWLLMFSIPDPGTIAGRLPMLPLAVICGLTLAWCLAPKRTKA